MNKNINKKSKLTYLVATTLSVCIFFSACTEATPELSPMPAINMSKNTTEANVVILETPQDTKELPALSPIEISEPIDELINQGSNIENNGIALAFNETIYFVQNGLNSISANGRHRKILLEQADMICLNIYKDYIYYVSSIDYSIYKIDINAENTPISLNISGAYSMMIIQDHIYYQSAIGENADNYIYRTDMDGSNQENLMIKASVFCTDGQSIYYSNQEDENRIYSLDTCSGEIKQLSNNQASQLNIIDGNLYYINKTTKYITKLNIETLESAIITEQACTYLNSNTSKLVFYFEEDSKLGTMNIDGTEINYILEYEDINGLNVAGDWVFFESYNNTFEDEVFFLKTDGESLSRLLPTTFTAKIIDYDPTQKTIYIDYVKYLTGEVALEEYLKDHAVSERNAKEKLDETDGVYIQNTNPKIVEYKASDLTQINLYINSDSSQSVDSHSVSIAEFEEILSENPSLILEQIYNITSFEGQLVRIEQFNVNEE